MKYVVDDKKLDAVTFIAFINQVWKAVTMLKERKVHCLRRSILPLMIMSYWLVACVSLQTDIISVRLQSCLSFLNIKNRV